MGTHGEDLESRVTGYTYQTQVKHGHISLGTLYSIITYPSHIGYCLEVWKVILQGIPKDTLQHKGHLQVFLSGNPRFCVQSLI